MPKATRACWAPTATIEWHPVYLAPFGATAATADAPAAQPAAAVAVAAAAEPTPTLTTATTAPAAAAPPAGAAALAAAALARAALALAAAALSLAAAAFAALALALPATALALAAAALALRAAAASETPGRMRKARSLLRGCRAQEPGRAARGVRAHNHATHITCICSSRATLHPWPGAVLLRRQALPSLGIPSEWLLCFGSVKRGLAVRA